MSTLTVNIDPEAGDSAPLLRHRTFTESRHGPGRPPPNQSTNKAENLDEKLSRLAGDPKRIMEHLLLNRFIEKDTMKKGKTLIDVTPVDVLSLVNNEGKTALHAAVEKKYLDVCKALMFKVPSLLTTKDKRGETPLHYIVKGDFLEAFEAALKYAPDLDVNTGDNQNYTPVHLAAMNNNKSLLRRLISLGGRVSAKTHHKFTPLHFAAKKGFNQCVEVIINAETEDERKKSLMDTLTKDRSTALILAAAGGHSDCCVLLDKTNVNLQDKDGNTALHNAAQKGYISTVKVLERSLHAHITVRNKNGYSPLHCAASNRNELCLTYLLNLVEKVEEPEKLLMRAVESQCNKSVEVLLNRPEVKESIDKSFPAKGDTALHVSLQKGSPSITRLLLQHNADKNVVNKRMEYPLHLAAQQKKSLDDAEEVERLMMCREILKDSHEIVNKTNKEKQNPLFLAAKSGNEGMVHSLLQKGAKVIVEGNELTAVHVAAQYGRNDIMIALLRSLDAKQLIELSNRKPHPLHLAAKHGRLHCCKTLLKRSTLDMSNLLDNDRNYPLDLAAQHGRHEVFRFLLHEMPFDQNLKDFGCNIHGYFKQAISQKNESVLDAIINSSWVCVIFDHTYCQGENVLKNDRKSFANHQRLNKQMKPCESFVHLVQAFPCTASAALDRHITKNSDGSTVCNYTPFEFNYCNIADGKTTSPFVCGQSKHQQSQHQENNARNTAKGSHHINLRERKQRSDHQEGKQQLNNKERFSDIGHSEKKIQSNSLEVVLKAWQKQRDNGDVESLPKSSAKECRIDPTANELGGVLWEKQHPLLNPSVTKCKDILNHKLTKSWMDIKICRYTRKLFVAYVTIFAIIALATTGSFSCLWNTYHLEAHFNGASRMEITTVFNEIYTSNYPNEAVEQLVSEVRKLSQDDPNCSQLRVPVLRDTFSEDIDAGSPAWSRAVCAIVHLEANSVAVIFVQLFLVPTYLVFVLANVYIWLKAKGMEMAWFHSTRYSLVICLPVIFIPVTRCDFFLGMRPDEQWQFGVIVVLTTWLTTATAMNNVFAIFATITKHFLFNYSVTMLPVFLIMYGFALAFHLLLTVEGGAMSTFLDTISKTFLWIMDEFEHKDIFRQNNPRLNFPTTGKLLYVLYGIIVGGLLFNLILMNTGDNLRSMKRKVNLDRSKQSLQRVILVDALFPSLRRKYAKCHVTHTSDCDHFNSQDGRMGLSGSSNFGADSSSLGGNYFLHSGDGTYEQQLDTTRQLGLIMKDMESLKKDVHDILNKLEEKQNLSAKRI